MDLELVSLRLEAAAKRRTQALLVLMADGDEPAGDDALSAWISQALADGACKTEAGSLLSSYGIADVTARQVVLAGVGEGKPAAVRKAVATAVTQLRKGPGETLTVCFAADSVSGESVHAVVLGAADAAYVYQTTHGKSADKVAPKLKSVAVGVPDTRSVRADFDRAVGTARGVALAREWANRPGNHATPTLLAGAAQTLAKPRGSGISCKVLGPKDVAKLGMGAFQAVAQGSNEELRFIELRYNGGAKDEAPVVLVGKGITFDTGGISIKPAAEMDEMKFDMGGAASVLGTFAALAELRPAINVVGLIAACENMPDGKSVKPGDVVTSMSGQTIEILNTDAEGRLVLCDALTYAERFKPRAVIDIATLTGACVIALGGVHSGMFATTDELADGLTHAGQRALDTCWRMPLDAEYDEGLKTNFADVANVAGRAAGVVTAAKFLQRFAGEFDWAHLDIAGTAWKGGAAKGATGRPVGLLVEYLLSQQDEAKPASKAPVKAAKKASGKRAAAK